MSRVQKVTAEPKVEDLLASIRRAIGEEGVDLFDMPSAVREPRLSASPMRPVSEAARHFDDLPQQSTARGGMPEFRTMQAGDHHEDRKQTAPSDILALRDKIGRELQGEPDPPGDTLPPETVSVPGSYFRGILSGREERGPHAGDVHLAPATSTLRSIPAGSSTEDTPAYPRTVDQPAPALNRAPGFGPQPAAFDIPGRGAAGLRPPYGNGSFGVRSYSPPGHRAEPGMMSVQSGSLATGAFGKLTDTLVQRGGERSIDDLTRELLRPMLKQWLDLNLPRLVEALVREEIERVARRGGR